MHPADELAVRIALADEQRSESSESESDSVSVVETNELLVIERQGFTTASAFNVKEPGTSMPIAGPGTLKSLLIIAEDDTFEVFFEIDGQTVIDDSFTALEEISDELPDISAYERGDGFFVVTVQDYEFQSAVNAVISPTASATFTRQRAEVDVIRDVFQ